MAQHDATCDKETPTFTQFNSLPTEIRALIWEASLPSRRIFHIEGDAPILPQHNHRHRKRFIFHAPHRAPIATRVCRESRAACLRRGFFFPHCPDVWFNPDVDMLYIGRHHRRYIQSKDGKPMYHVAGLDRVKHVGIEWRAWFRDIPALQSDESMQQRWQHALRSLSLYMPRLQTINFVLPQTRYRGSMSFGREPYGARKQSSELVPLPDHVRIPWGQTASMAEMNSEAAMGAAHLAQQLSRRLVTWESIREQMVRSLESDEEAGTVYDGLGDGLLGKKPQVVGWWLIRAGGAKYYDDPEVKTFLS